MKTNEILNELFKPDVVRGQLTIPSKKSFPFKWEKDSDAVNALATFRDSQKNGVDVAIDKRGFGPNVTANVYQIEFNRQDSSKRSNYHVTGQGEIEPIFLTVIKILLDFEKQFTKPDYLLFDASEPSRRRFYNTLIKRFAPLAGYAIVPEADIPELIKMNTRATGPKQFVLKRIKNTP